MDSGRSQTQCTKHRLNIVGPIQGVHLLGGERKGYVSWRQATSSDQDAGPIAEPSCAGFETHPRSQYAIDRQQDYIRVRIPEPFLDGA